MNARRKPNNLPRLLMLIVLALATGGVAPAQLAGQEERPPVPADPLAYEVQLVLAVPFTLDQPYVHWWRAERPRLDAGFVLVLAAHPDLLLSRQGPEPILQVGQQTAERLHSGHGSGHVVVFVPAPRDGQGRPALDLERTLIFFGRPGLPEELDAEAIAGQLEAARARGHEPPARETVAGALQPPVHFADDGDLRVWAADLVERYAPQEVDVISGMRAPRLRR